MVDEGIFTCPVRNLEIRVHAGHDLICIAVATFSIGRPLLLAKIKFSACTEDLQ